MRVLCDTLGVCRAGFYAWQQRPASAQQQRRDALLVEIGDDGQGFDLAQENEGPNTYGGMGLSNVRERVGALGGTVAVWSLPGKGTTLHLCIPLVQLPAAGEERERIDQELTTAFHK